MMRVWTAIGAMVLTGCMPMEEPVPPRDDPRYTCDAGRVQGLVGQVATQKLAAEAVRAAGARTMRWIEPGHAYTMDYRTDRLNLHLDARNVITKVDCG